MLTKEDLKYLKNKGISRETVEEQIKRFEHGYPFPEVIAPATQERGITVLSKEEQFGYVKKYSSFTGNILKFVPASGAASRMFKALYEAIDIAEGSGGDVPDSHIATKQFLNQINKYPFYEELKEHVEISGSNSLEILKALLYDYGMGYGNMPKGLIKFHKYRDIVRTAFEEHLFGAFKYAQDKKNRCRLLFTVSPEHMGLFRDFASKASPAYEQKSRCTYDIDFTIQKESTDTIAVDMNNTPLRNDAGELVFRPGGHGALIENLNDTDADLVFIRNIDNVSREELTIDTVWWKKVIAGMMIDVREQIYSYLRVLDGERDEDIISEIKLFIKNVLSVDMPNLSPDIEIEYLKARLNRPLRVCGMVKNLGEPGGGPFLVRDDDGAVSLQILESAQLDKTNKNVVKLLESATHFNPVDIVCSFRDYKGNQFNLTEYIDNDTGFISIKSIEGKSVKVLELPGLWNGAMSRWNTVFVEVPITTFTPVKTVYDLLRPEHQG